MDVVRVGLGLIGTVVIAGWVAFSVSAPRNFDNAMNETMNQPMASLDGKSINDEMARQAAAVRADQCARFTALANEAWDRSLEQGTTDRDQIRLDDLDRQKASYCNN